MEERTDRKNKHTDSESVSAAMRTTQEQSGRQAEHTARIASQHTHHDICIAEAWRTVATTIVSSVACVFQSIFFLTSFSSSFLTGLCPHGTVALVEVFMELFADLVVTWEDGSSSSSSSVADENGHVAQGSCAEDAPAPRFETRYSGKTKRKKGQETQGPGPTCGDGSFPVFAKGYFSKKVWCIWAACNTNPKRERVSSLVGTSIVFVMTHALQNEIRLPK